VSARQRRTLLHGRVPLLLLVAAVLLVSAVPFAQEATPPAAPRQAGPGTQDGQPAPHESTTRDDASGGGTAGRTARFLLGGAAGLGLHESGHLLFDGLFGVRPMIKRVDFGGIPFFAITHRAGLPPRQEFTITSAGFWSQQLSSEIMLSRRPHLRDERAPIRKGLLAFNVIASLADALGVNEPWVGGLVLTPACLDAWRYFHPEARWAKWVSRGVKVGMVLLVAR
jgi:hypothetical protein